jgi:hypothetical protein
MMNDAESIARRYYDAATGLVARGLTVQGVKPVPWDALDHRTQNTMISAVAELLAAEVILPGPGLGAD